MRLLFLLIAICFCSSGFTQLAETYFHDTTVRSKSNLSGSFVEGGSSIYLWGNGIGKFSQNQPFVQMIDTSGARIWHTGKDTMLAFEGYVLNAFVDENYLFAFGLRTSTPYSFYMAKLDKNTGVALYQKILPVNFEGIIRITSKGADSLQIIYYTRNYGYSPSNNPPIHVISVSKSTGLSSEPLLYGKSDLAPLYIDHSGNAYYYLNYSIIKYNVPTATIIWSNLVNGPAPLSLIKDSTNVYVLGDRYCKRIDDNTGNTVWHIAARSYYNHDYFPNSTIIKADTLYVSWTSPYVGSISAYGQFSKINKKDGTLYLHGVITDSAGVEYTGKGSFLNGRLGVDASGDIYMMGTYINNDFPVIKKLSGATGKLIFQMKLPADTVAKNNYRVINDGYIRDSKNVFIFNNRACFLYDNHVTDNQSTSVRVNYLQLNVDGSVAKKTGLDNNNYQYSSAVLAIQKKGLNTYVLKKQGAAAYMEKYTAGLSLAWRKDLSTYCIFTPQTFAIDSAENICVIGAADAGCVPMPDENTLNSFLPVNRVITIDKDGKTTSDIFEDFIGSGQMYNLLGVNQGFYLASNMGSFRRINQFWVESPIAYRTLNFSRGIFNAFSNKAFHSVNGKDSVYFFSSKTNEVSSGFHIAVNKVTGKSTTTVLGDFPWGYIIHAVKSKTDSSMVYVSGVDGNSPGAILIKFDLSTKTTKWKYKSSDVGEVFKVTEDGDGNIYAIVQIPDSTKIIKFNGNNGKVIWQYRRYENSNLTKMADIDVNTNSKTVIAAGVNTVNGYSKSDYNYNN